MIDDALRYKIERAEDCLMLRFKTTAIGALILAVLGGLAVSLPAIGGETAIAKG